ncbi:MAG: hypothetical protein ACRDFC_03725 [Ignavibacteria bacterium]
MKKYLSAVLLILFASFSFVHFQCTAAYDAFVNLQRLQFKLGSVNNFKLAGINIGSIRTINDFSIVDGANLIAAFTRGELPASFTLNVLAKNPNDGTGGTRRTAAVLKSLTWRLFLDDKETINGNIPNSIEIPGVGQETTIPVVMSLDLVRFFQNQGYESLINLALALGGVSGSAARITLKATPTVDTFLGPITYPGEISIIDKEFRSQ